MRRKPSVLLISIAVHAIVLLLLAAAPWWSPITNWPMPREVLAFTVSPRVARPQDIELPRAPRTRAPGAPASASFASPELAPIVAPTGVAPEPAREEAAGPLSAVEPADRGTGTVDGVGVAASMPPPPAPKPPEPVRPGGMVRQPEKIVHVAPQYPQIAVRRAFRASSSSKRRSTAKATWNQPPCCDPFRCLIRQRSQRSANGSSRRRC